MGAGMNSATFRNEDDARAAYRSIHWYSYGTINPWWRVVALRDSETVTLLEEYATEDMIRRLAQIADALGGVQS